MKTFYVWSGDARVEAEALNPQTAAQKFVDFCLRYNPGLGSVVAFSRVGFDETDPELLIADTREVFELFDIPLDRLPAHG